jgi:hypothetical protein
VILRDDRDSLLPKSAAWSESKPIIGNFSRNSAEQNKTLHIAAPRFFYELF